MIFEEEWEIVNDDTRRLRVPKGWIVNVYTTIISNGQTIHAANCLEFVPDAEHQWELRK